MGVTEGQKKLNQKFIECISDVRGTTGFAFERALTCLDDGADVNTVDHRGKSAIHLVLEKTSHHYGIWCLIEKGADINMIDQYGNTPIIKAKMCGRKSSFEMLLEAGADPTIKNHAGKRHCDYSFDGGVDIYLERLERECDEMAAQIFRCMVDRASSHYVQCQNPFSLISDEVDEATLQLRGAVKDVLENCSESALWSVRACLSQGGDPNKINKLTIVSNNGFPRELIIPMIDAGLVLSPREVEKWIEKQLVVPYRQARAVVYEHSVKSNVTSISVWNQKKNHNFPTKRSAIGR
ncbi:TPA: ankyrin repeat domain-containing protein [Stenotrophomonas maltophilia]|nr:ankyrin repeat domain-containing protein [Stenotrophomonas maltophilia]HEL4163147.1 ankyrin repeat domain-containing protein [Stenotrophomonas maltophilia]